MAWIRSHQELAHHPKVKRLARKLKIPLPQVIGHLHLLWWWCMDYAQDGNLTEYESEDIADAAMWEGDAEEFVNAMITAGFIDSDEDGLYVHDWEENAGRLIEQRKRNKERMKRVRAEDVQRTCNARATHNECTSAHVQRLDKIREDKIREEGGKIYTTHERSNSKNLTEEHEGTDDIPSPHPHPIDAQEESATTSENPIRYPAGWEPTPETRHEVIELLHRLESLFGVCPISPKQMGSGEADVMKEELAAILRLLTLDEVVEVVRQKMEERSRETKGVDRPRNLKWYMPAIKEAFYKRDRELEEQERQREEEKRARERASPDNPVLLGEVLENSMPGPKGPKKALSEEEIVQRIKEIRTRIKGAGV